MKRLIIALLVIIGFFNALEALLCNPANPDLATSIIYVGYPTTTITFDNLGFSAAQPWSSSSGAYPLYNNNGQTITVSGSSCVIMNGVQTLGLAAWNSSHDWQYFPTYYPGYFMALQSENGQCEFTFNPPIAEFAFRYNTNLSPVGTLHVYDYYNHLISCSKMIQNPGYNYYNYTGFRGLVEIKRAVISSGLVVLDDIKWTTGCGDAGLYDPSTGICPSKNRCTELQICNNMTYSCNTGFGSVQCSCNSGYNGDGFGSKGCIDDNECVDHPCAEVATCTNYPGYYKCECPYGYSGLGDTQGGQIPGCEDINECQTISPCYSMASCTNYPGSYECTCPSGFGGNGLDPFRYSNGTGCNDIDECSLETSPCSSAASCENTYGAYQCTCNKGYTGDGIGEFGCFDENECDDSPCALDATCTNTDGSYECACPTGYVGTGKGNNGCTLDSTPVGTPAVNTPIAAVTSSAHLVPLLGHLGLALSALAYL